MYFICIICNFYLCLFNPKDVTITNDGATILKLLEIEHPAAKILVDLAELQDQEVGDGTTSVVSLGFQKILNIKKKSSYFIKIN